MKRIFFITILIGSLSTACDGVLDQEPISSATTETFYTSTDDFIQGMNAVYSSLQNYPERILNLSETRSDNLYAVSVGGVRDWEGVNSFHTTISSNPYVTEAWNTNFNGIYRANVLLQELEQNGNIITDLGVRTRLEAEAKFLRAFFYFDLVKWFGKVPIADHPLTAKESISIPRSPVSDVYDLIISDLQFAVENLPGSYGEANQGRATKYAAEGILAKVYMTRSEPTYGIDGPGLGLDEWNLALPLLNDIIQNSPHSFLDSYSDIFSYTNEHNAEVIFDINFITGANPVLGSSFPGLLVPDKYFQSLGVVISAGTNIRPVSNNLLDSYESGDIRRPFSIKTGYVRPAEGLDERSFFIKYLDTDRIPTDLSDWSVNFIVLRYTDVLMLKAECILHGAPGSQAEVDEIVNQVRARAELDPVANVTLPELMEERRKEFAAEGVRWHDLVRSGLIESTMSDWIAEDDVQNQINPFVKNFIIYPIPQAELDVAEDLYEQNPGY